MASPRTTAATFFPFVLIELVSAESADHSLLYFLFGYFDFAQYKPLRERIVG